VKKIKPVAKGGFRGVLGVHPPPPSRFIAPLSKFLLAERGSGKSCSSVSLDNLQLSNGAGWWKKRCIEAVVVAKMLGDGP